MPTIFTHAFTGVVAGKIGFQEKLPRKFWLLALLLPIIPDFDVIGFPLGIKYADMLGHRGLTHSLAFAIVAGFSTVGLFFKEEAPFSRRWWGLAIFFTLLTASHGVFDAMTRGGGLGVAFFAPFDNTRYFLPWRVIKVSPIRPRSFLSERGVKVVITELLWVWLPFLLIWASVFLFRKLRKKG